MIQVAGPYLPVGLRRAVDQRWEATGQRSVEHVQGSSNGRMPESRVMRVGRGSHAEAPARPARHAYGKSCVCVCGLSRSSVAAPTTDGWVSENTSNPRSLSLA